MNDIWQLPDMEVFGGVPIPRLTTTPFRTALSELEVIADLTDPEAEFAALPSVGLLAPVILTRKGESLTILDGVRRRRTLLERGERDCRAIIVDPPFEPVAAGVMRILLNRSRTAGIGESLRYLRWLTETAGIASVREIEEITGFDPGRQSQLMPLLSAGSFIVDAVVKGCLDISRVRDLLQLDPQSQRCVIDLFSEMSFSVQTQREILEWLPEIAWARQCAPYELLCSEEPGRIRTDSHLNGPQRIQAFRESLFRIRFPLYANTLERWSRLAAASNPLPGKIRFEHDPAFERKRLLIHVRVDDPHGAQSIGEQLSRIPADTWRALIDPIEYGDAQKSY